MSDEAPRSFEVEVNPAVLVWARETAGVELDWAARRISRTAEVLRAWELGESKPTFAALLELAHLYDRPAAVLLLPEPPVEPPPPPDRRAFSRRRPRPLGYSSLAALREARRLRSLAAELFEHLGLRPQLPIGALDASADPEEAAVQERNRLGISVEEQSAWNDDYDAWWSWRGAIEALNVLVLQFSMRLEELRGFALSEGADPPVMAVSGKDRIRPRMFTLLHEYGHLLLGSASLCLPSSTSRSRLERGDIETFCNDFAGAVLVPRESLLQHPATDAIRSSRAIPADEALRPLTGYFRVTKYVVWRRLAKAEVISAEMHDRKWGQWQADLDDWAEATGGRATPAESAISSRGPRFVSLLLQGERQGIVPYADLPQALGARLSHLDEVERRLSELGTSR